MTGPVNSISFARHQWTVNESRVPRRGAKLLPCPRSRRISKDSFHARSHSQNVAGDQAGRRHHFDGCSDVEWFRSTWYRGTSQHPDHARGMRSSFLFTDGPTQGGLSFPGGIFVGKRAGRRKLSSPFTWLRKHNCVRRPARHFSWKRQRPLLAKKQPGLKIRPGRCRF